MTKVFFRTALICSLFILLPFLTGMGKAPDAASIVGIESTTIRDHEVLEKSKPLVITFSAPMVTVQDSNKKLPVSKMPIMLDPPVPGSGEWTTESSFSFIATNGYQRGKNYRVFLQKNLTALNGSPVQHFFSFSTAAMKIEHLDFTGIDKKNNTVFIKFSFSSPVSYESVKAHLAIVDAGTGEVLPFVVENKESLQTVVPVAIESGKFRPHLKVTVAVDEANEQNSLGLSHAYSAVISVPSSKSAAAFDGKVMIEKDETTPSKQSINYAYSQEDYSTGEISVHYRLSQSIDTQKDYEKYIKIEPELPYIVRQDGRAIDVVSGVVAGATITVSLMPGLADTQGRILTKTQAFSEKVSDRVSRVDFADKGNFLSVSATSAIPITLTNVDMVKVTLYRMYDNNLPFSSYNGGMELYGRQILSKEINITLNKNEVTHKTVDIAELAGEERGFFYVSLEGYTKNNSGATQYMSYEYSSRRLIVLTDIGIASRVFPSGLTVFASSLENGSPLDDAAVAIYSASNQLIGEGRTNNDGLFVHKRNEAWDDQLLPNVILVTTKNDTSFLQLDSSVLISREDVGDKQYMDQGYEAFVYAPRGVFRPGETVQIKTFIRDAQRKVPSTFPVIFIVTNSRGIELVRKSSQLSDQGGADISFDLPASAPTGEYLVNVVIPGQEKKVLGITHFSVEDFVPPRLEVKLAPVATFFTDNNPLAVKLQADYLFGVPGKGLRYELGWRATGAAFLPKGWEGYVFGDGEKKFGVQTVLKHTVGFLDDNGKANEVLMPQEDWSGYTALDLLLLLTVQEDNGRWVTQTAPITYYPSPYLLGLKVTTNNDLVTIDTVALTPDEQLADPGALTIKLYAVDAYWNTVYRNNRYTYLWEEKITFLESKEVATHDGKASVSFDTKGSRRYLIRCESKKDGIVGSHRFSTWANDKEGAASGGGRMDLIELAFDKPEYKAGDTAKVIITSPYVGTLFLGLEQKEQIDTRVITMKQPSITIDIPVTKEMAPNSKITAWVIRPVNADDKEWYSHRAYGFANLSLSNNEHALSVVAEVPEKNTPGKPLSIAFTVTDKDGTPVQGEFSVGLVDEGVLSLTAYTTPSPLGFFMGNRRSVGTSYDAYDRLIRPAAKPNPLLAAGGDNERAYHGSLSPQRIFLTAFTPTVITDVQGRGIAQFVIPEYSGKGRLMIVGGAGDLFASTASSVMVGRDVEAEISVPQAVAPTDTFAMSVKLFSRDATLKEKITTKITVSGPAQVASEAIFLKGTSGTVTIEALSEEGIATVQAIVDVEGRPDLSFSKEVEFAVRSPFPRTSSTAFSLVNAGSSATLQPEGIWIPGSASTVVSLASSPVFSVLPALEFLREYPYGCLEQTVSRAWPFLVLPEIQTLLSGEKYDAVESNTVLSRAIEHLCAMQTADGGFGMWPGVMSSDPWKSVNTTLFLIEAKQRVAVPESVIQRSVAYLTMLLAMPESYFDDNNQRLAYSIKAYAAFVLTRNGQAPLSWIQHLKAKESLLTPSGRIYLALSQALIEGNPTALRTLQLEPAKDADQADIYNKTLESTVRNLSLQLYAWSLIDPMAKETVELSFAVAQALQSKKLLTTQEAGMAALAIGTYIEKAGFEKNNITVILSANGKELASPVQELPKVLSFDGILGDGNVIPITVTANGKGQAYAVYSVRGIPAEAPKAFSSGLGVIRKWYDDKNNSIDLNAKTVTLQKGQRIIVALEITSQYPLADVIVSDLLPGGLELENPRLKTTGAFLDAVSEQEGIGESNNDESRSFAAYEAYLDARDDRLLVIFGGVNGSRKYYYTLRAVTSGTFILPPIAAEAMYAPTATSVGSTSSLTVE